MSDISPEEQASLNQRLYLAVLQHNPVQVSELLMLGADRHQELANGDILSNLVYNRDGGILRENDDAATYKGCVSARRSRYCPKFGHDQYRAQFLWARCRSYRTTPPGTRIVKLLLPRFLIGKSS